MADLLNYRPSSSAVHYVPPRRFDLVRMGIGFLGAVLGAIVGGVIYGQIQPGLRSLIVRVGAVFVAAGATGLLALAPVRYGKLRIAVVAASMGAVIALIAIYSMWLSWVHEVLTNAGVAVSYQALLTHPHGVFRLIQGIERVGTWTYHGDAFNGPVLLVCWLIEAALVLGAGVLVPVFGLYSSDPVCSACGSRCRQVSGMPRFATHQQDEFIAAIENRAFDAIASHEPPPHDDAPELSIRLMRCSQCKQTNVVTINRIAWGWVANQRRVETKPLLKDLLITGEEADRLVEVCTQVKQQRKTPPAVSEEPPAEDGVAPDTSSEPTS